MDDALIVANAPGVGAMSCAMPRVSQRTRRERIPAHLLFMAGLTLVFCALDACMTLTLIASSHFYEANPVMDVLLRADTRLFVAAKMLITGAGLAVLLHYSQTVVFKTLRVSRILGATCACYAALIGYEVMMLIHVV